MKELIALTNIEFMTSLEIAELIEKRHDTLKKSVKRLVASGVIELPPMAEIQTSTKPIQIYRINKRDTYVVVAQMYPAFTGRLVDRWQYLEGQLEILKRKDSTKKHQLNAMEALQNLLPDDLQGEAVSYIKANCVVNKATSNLFGFPKMLKKDDMSDDMKVMREKILDHYLMLFEFFEDNTKVSELLYEKYQPKRIENQSVELKLVTA